MGAFVSDKELDPNKERSDKEAIFLTNAIYSREPLCVTVSLTGLCILELYITLIQSLLIHQFLVPDHRKLQQTTSLVKYIRKNLQQSQH